MLFTLLLVFACGDTKKSTQEELHDKVMALHDEIMPKMGDIMKYKKQLNNKIDALIEEGTDVHADKIDELRNVVEDLENTQCPQCGGNDATVVSGTGYSVESMEAQ